ncbi:MAG TPA: polysaccharide lyase family 7 protein [Pseudonocardia sp.]|nr:polysaccharide lyase family 7 protein [Pseudonocardia sp.]
MSSIGPFQEPSSQREPGPRAAVGAGRVLVVALLGIGLVACGGRGDNPSRSAAPPSAGGIPAHPTEAFDLAGWKLSIPETNSKGDAASIQPATTRAPWLSEGPDGGLDFWAPTQGATTKNSTHPRTELQSLTTFDAGTAPHTLSASLTLTQLPRDGRGIIVGQIHGADDISSVPYVMLRVQDNALRVVVKQVQDGDAHIDYPLLDGVGLNSSIDYTITDRGDGTMTFAATGNGVTRQAEAPVPAAFRGATVRFQAGDYQQADASAGPQDGGRVVFHRLTQQ